MLKLNMHFGLLLQLATFSAWKVGSPISRQRRDVHTTRISVPSINTQQTWLHATSTNPCELSKMECNSLSYLPCSTHPAHHCMCGCTAIRPLSIHGGQVTWSTCMLHSQFKSLIRSSKQDTLIDLIDR